MTSAPMRLCLVSRLTGIAGPASFQRRLGAIWNDEATPFTTGWMRTKSTPSS
jgi:hypothetical protein